MILSIKNDSINDNSLYKPIYKEDYTALIQTGISGINKIHPWELMLSRRRLNRLVSESKLNRISVYDILYQHLVMSMSLDIINTDDGETFHEKAQRATTTYSPLNSATIGYNPATLLQFSVYNLNKLQCYRGNSITYNGMYQIGGVYITTGFSRHSIHMCDEPAYYMNSQLVDRECKVWYSGIKDYHMFNQYTSIDNEITETDISKLVLNGDILDLYDKCAVSSRNNVTMFKVLFNRKDFDIKEGEDNIFDFVAKKMNYRGVLESFVQTFMISRINYDIDVSIDLRGVYTTDDLPPQYLSVSMTPDWYSDLPEFNQVVRENGLFNIEYDDNYRIYPLFSSDYKTDFPKNSVIYQTNPQLYNRILNEENNKILTIRDKYKNHNNTKDISNSGDVDALVFGDTLQTSVNNAGRNTNLYSFAYDMGKFFTKIGGYFPLLDKNRGISNSFIFTPESFNEQSTKNMLFNLFHSTAEQLYSSWLNCFDNLTHDNRNSMFNSVIIIPSWNEDNVIQIDTEVNTITAVKCIVLTMSDIVYDESNSYYTICSLQETLNFNINDTYEDI